jgi:ribosome-associated protein
LKDNDMELLQKMMEILRDMKAEDPVILDLRDLTAMTDFFLVAHGGNVRHVGAMGRELEERLARELGTKPHHVEGVRTSRWVLMDYGTVIVHLFLEERRKYYGLESIWMDAPRLAIDSE